ncbi:hypothetical protein HPP92_011858 [Vanilla planifolia]|uniref:Uncharacterized protein n=1 Tax=Vanilla planifolia TaxID=51239 RepID=A0A835V272_VANPL|nr:hypothetical protein HPP92_011858 [Vanilla planifolia]
MSQKHRESYKEDLKKMLSITKDAEFDRSKVGKRAMCGESNWRIWIKINIKVTPNI